MEGCSCWYQGKYPPICLICAEKWQEIPSWAAWDDNQILQSWFPMTSLPTWHAEHIHILHWLKGTQKPCYWTQHQIYKNCSLIMSDLSFRGSVHVWKLKSTHELCVISRAHCTGVSEGTKVALMAIRPPISSSMREEAAFQRWKHGSVGPHWIHMSENGRNPQGGNSITKLFSRTAPWHQKLLHTGITVYELWLPFFISWNLA